jgi:hypothetical protein
MMTEITLLAFALVSFIGIATPGPTVLLALTNGSRFGVRRALVGMFGAVLSDFVLIGAVALGLGALLAASEFWFSVVKWVGVGYLVFLGIMLLRSKGMLNETLRGEAGEFGIGAFDLSEEFSRRGDEPERLLVLLGLPAAIHRAGFAAGPSICRAGAGLCSDRFPGHVRICDAWFASRARAEEVRRAVARPYLRRRALDACRLTGFLPARERLKRVAIFQIRFPRFRSLILRMSLSQNHCTLLRDMLQAWFSRACAPPSIERQSRFFPAATIAGWLNCTRCRARS